MLGLLGPGRATGNWLAAASGTVPIDDYVNKYLKARKDFGDLLKKDESKAAALEEMARITPLGDYGRVFTYSSNEWRYYDEEIIPDTSETHKWLMN
jgi:hypothetical protein